MRLTLAEVKALKAFFHERRHAESSVQTAAAADKLAAALERLDTFNSFAEFVTHHQAPMTLGIEPSGQCINCGLTFTIRSVLAAHGAVCGETIAMTTLGIIVFLIASLGCLVPRLAVSQSRDYRIYNNDSTSAGTIRETSPGTWTRYRPDWTRDGYIRQHPDGSLTEYDNASKRIRTYRPSSTGQPTPNPRSPK